MLLSREMVSTSKQIAEAVAGQSDLEVFEGVGPTARVGAVEEDLRREKKPLLIGKRLCRARNMLTSDFIFFLE